MGMVNRTLAPARPGERWARTTCHGCASNTCGMWVLVRNGAVVKAVGDPGNPFNGGKLCAKSHAYVFGINNPRRLKRPLKRTNPQKGIGIDPGWMEISYAEAWDTVARKLKEIRERDPSRLLILYQDFTTHQWLQGPLEASWGNAMRLMIGYCGNAVHWQTLMYWGAFHVYPDWKYTRYLILMGSQEGANVQHASLTAAWESAEARSRGVKVVSVDPLGTNAPSKSSEWLPIRPGTDGALVLGWMNVLVNELGIYDGEFLRAYTNAPYLINEDGRYIRDPATKKPMMWDEASGAVKAYNDPSIGMPALEGRYQVRLGDGKVVQTRTAFEILKEQLLEWTPQRVSEITTIPADTIRRIAREYGEAASIGSTIVIDGEVLPFRPVGVHWYKGISTHRNGYNTGRLISLLNVLVGAIDVPGGMMSEAVYSAPPGIQERNLANGDKSGFADDGDGILVVPGGPVGARTGGRALGMPPSKPQFGPDGRPLGAARNLGRLFPAVGYAGGALVEGDMLHPDRHGKAFSPNLPEAIVGIFTSSYMFNKMDPGEMANIFSNAFYACVVSVIDETAELADIVIPSAHFLERLEMFANPETNFSGSTHDGEYYCWNIRAPVVEVETPHHVQTWIEIAQRVGFLSDLNEVLNKSMDLRGDNRLDTEAKHNYRELVGRWVKQRLGRSLDDVLAEQGGHIKWKKSVKERYPRVYFKDSRIPLYEEKLVGYKEGLDEVLREMKVDGWDTSQYVPIPNWVPCRAYERKDKGEYDLVPVTYKVPFVSAQFSLVMPWIAELAELHPYVFKVWMNSETARRKGLVDGDLVRVESLDTKKAVEGRLKVSECVHPEVVGLSSHGGHWAKDFGLARGKGMAWQWLVYNSHETMDPLIGTPDNCVPVKVTRAPSPPPDRTS